MLLKLIYKKITATKGNLDQFASNFTLLNEQRNGFVGFVRADMSDTGLTPAKLWNLFHNCMSE